MEADEDFRSTGGIVTLKKLDSATFYPKELLS
jgi:hypothetical protein